MVTTSDVKSPKCIYIELDTLSSYLLLVPCIFLYNIIQNSDGNTGLTLVSSSGEKVVAELLIDKGAKVKHQNKVRKYFISDNDVLPNV